MATTQQKQYQKQLREERKQWGVCIECGKRPPFAGRVRCEECLCRDLLAHPSTLSAEKQRKQTESRKAKRAERRAAGLCINCGKPVYKDHTRCYEHYLKNKRASDKYRWEHRTGRVKPWNTPPPPRKQNTEHPWNQMNKLIKRWEQEGKR